MQKGARSGRCENGFTILEAVITVLVLSTLLSGTMMLVYQVRQGAIEEKLRKDVSTLNSAVRVFVANGGDLSGLKHPEDVLEQLKTATAIADSDSVVGLRGSALDFRVKAVMQTTSEAATKKPRALWNPAKQRFEIAKVGGDGVGKFVLDKNALFTNTEAKRYTNLQYAHESRWVWDYTDRDGGGGGGPANVPHGGRMVSLVTAPLSKDPLQLTAPIVDLRGDTRELIQYPLTVSLIDPNYPGVATLMASTNPGVWSEYTGPLQIEPGEILQVMAVSNNPEQWLDSFKNTQTYDVADIAPELVVSFPTMLNYFDLGGLMLSPLSDAVSRGAAYGKIGLGNSDDIPDRYQSSAYFKIYWTFDGSEPISAATRRESEPFANGFPGQEVPLSLDDWGTAEVLMVKLQAESQNEKVFQHSVVTAAEVAADALPLRAPVIDVEGSTIEIKLVTEDGDMPAGARIFYTTDGTDPGVGENGEPLGGTLYGGAFEQEEDAEIIARVYPPSAYAQWFVSSGSTYENFVSPYFREVFIGGKFALPDGRLRNVARLDGDGSIDSSFNTGLGASYGSIVTAIIPASGGRIVVGGDFDTMDNVPRGALVRLLPDGGVDPAFDAGLTIDSNPSLGTAP